MKNAKTNIKLLTILISVVGFALMETPSGLLAQEPAALQLPRPGLNLEITDITTVDRKLVVTFRITDRAGLALDRNGLLTEGSVAFRFVLARIDEGDQQYTTYTTRMKPGALGTVEQAWHESAGSYADLGNGTYSYTYRTTLGEGFDPRVTHTVAIAARRDLTRFDGQMYFASAVKNFVPSGGEVKTVRDVVRTDACNQCHNELAAHGGFWRNTETCVLCHQPQSLDAETGHSLDAPVLFHKIHMGADLPSVNAGTPYQVGDKDFSTGHFPPSLGSSLNNLRNCARCHTGSQGDHWRTRPTRAACGACHDDVNWQTGQNHLGGPQGNDVFCNRCHLATTDEEFDLSVAGEHVIPERSRQVPGVRFEIVSVTNTAPRQNPTVIFNITDRNGNPMAPSEMDLLQLTLAGPTTDYAQFWQEDARRASGPDAFGNYGYTFARSIPPDAQGTFAVGIEGYNNVSVYKGEQAETVRDAGFNQVVYISVTDSTPVPRRRVVDLANCNRCHDELASHETTRKNTEYCLLCHNPNQTDDAGRPPDHLPAETVHFKVLIHKIHRGDELENEYTVYGSGGRAFNFNQASYPGDAKDCATCHLPQTNLLPLPSGVLPTGMPRGEFLGLADPTPPITAACTACHDDLATVVHASTMAVGGMRENCITCHGEGKAFAVSETHAKVPGAAP